MSERPELTALTWPDGRPKIAPVQGYAQGIPWSLHLKAYNAYCKKYRPQEALIDLAGRECRGGFGVGELDEFVPRWRDEVEELALLKAQVSNLSMMLRRFIFQAEKTVGDNSLKVLAGKARQLLVQYGLTGSVLRDDATDGSSG